MFPAESSSLFLIVFNLLQVIILLLYLFLSLVHIILVFLFCHILIRYHLYCDSVSVNIFLFCLLPSLLTYFNPVKLIYAAALCSIKHQ